MKTKKPRLLVLTDIGGDPDDQQSLVRLLVYANEFVLEGVILEHWGYGEHKINPIQQMEVVGWYLDAYERVYPNLVRHSEDYPTAEYLRSIVKRGAVDMPFSPKMKIDSFHAPDYLGEDKDTEGSEWIIKLTDKEEKEPIHISVWGGTADLAQALWKVRHERDERELALFLSKIRVHAIADQDPTGLWIRENFPDLFYIFNNARNEDKLSSCYRGMYKNGDETLTSREWIYTHVKFEHGPLGALYPDKTWTANNPYGCLKEGDTPSWFYFLENGLNVPQHPEYGGWGGRFTGNGTYYQDAEDQIGNEKDGTVTTWRWRPAYQNDFAARMDRCTKSVEAVNHNPAVVLNDDMSKDMVVMQGKPGERVSLSAEGSWDPDGNMLFYRWWVYPEAGTYRGDIQIPDHRSMHILLDIPKDAEGTEIHIILEVSDDGNPVLTSYRRAIIQVN